MNVVGCYEFFFFSGWVFFSGGVGECGGFFFLVALVNVVGCECGGFFFSGGVGGCEFMSVMAAGVVAAVVVGGRCCGSGGGGCAVVAGVVAVDNGRN